VAPDTGLFGVHAVRIGQHVYTSEVYKACMGVPGVLAVHSLRLARQSGTGLQYETGFRFEAGEGGFFQLDPNDLTIAVEVASHAE